MQFLHVDISYFRRIKSHYRKKKTMLSYLYSALQLPFLHCTLGMFAHLTFIYMPNMETFWIKDPSYNFKKVYYHLRVSLSLPCSSAREESACNAGDLGLILPLGRSPGEGKGYPLQYFGLENSMDCIVHGVTKSWTQLNDFHFTSSLLGLPWWLRW